MNIKNITLAAMTAFITFSASAAVDVSVLGNQQAFIEKCSSTNVSVPNYTAEEYNASLQGSGSSSEEFNQQLVSYKESALRNIDELDNSDLNKVCNEAAN